MTKRLHFKTFIGIFVALGHRLPAFLRRPFRKGLCLAWLAALCLPHVAFCGGVVTTASQAALTAAMAGGGTVTFACDGIIELSATLAIANNTAFDGTGHSITISGSNSVPIFCVYTNASLMLTNLTLANGRNIATGDYYQFQGGFGGAICNTGMVLAVNCVFTNDAAIGLAGCLDAHWTHASPGSAGLGGCIYNLGTLIVSNSTFAGNFAVGGPGFTGDPAAPFPASQGGEGGGGAIYSVGNAMIVNCIFSSNSASGGAGGGWDLELWPRWVTPGDSGGVGNGGAICSSGLASVFDSTFVGNQAFGGAGGCGSTGDSYNRATGVTPGGAGAPGANGTGGGLCVEAGVLVVINSTFSGNEALGSAAGNGGDGGDGNGGVIYPPQSPAVGGAGGNGGNGGYGVGGGIGVLAGTATLTSVTLANNISTGGSAGAGGAGGNGYETNNGPNGTNGLPGLSQGQTIAAAGGNITLLNSILDCSSGAANGFGGIVDAGYNLNSDSTDYLTNSTSFNNTDPDLGPLGNFGGLTPTIPLLPGSPAIDAGDDLVTNITATDQRGYPRKFGAHVDIGACEWTPPVIQTSLNPLGHISEGEIAYDVAVAGNCAYLVGSDGLHVYDVSNPANPISLGQTTTGSGPTSVAITTHYAVLANYDAGLCIYDVANPASLASVGHCCDGGKAQCVRISGNYAYLANDVDGLRIYDISNPANPISVGHANDSGNAFGLAVSGQYAFLANNTDGLRVYDVSNPDTPVGVGHANDGGAAWSVAVSGNYAYVANSSDGLRVYDVSNPANPTSVGHVNDGGSASDVAAVGGSLVCLANGADGLRVYDVANPFNPVGVAHVNSGGSANGVAVSGQYVYLANSADGLRIYALTGVTPGLGIVCINGANAISISGLQGRTFEVQASTNLTDWQTIATMVNVAGTVQFSDANAPSFATRYYRLLML